MEELITNDIASEYKYTAKSALIVYQRGGNYYHGQKECYISKHEIRDGKVCEGYPVNRKDIYKLCKLVMPEIDIAVKYIPEELISYNPLHKYGVMVWWMSAGIRHMHFAVPGMKDGPVPVPPTLFAVSRGKLYVWAIKRNKRPTLDTPLYHPPYFNIFNDGTCMGNIVVPKKVDPMEIKKWEKLFFESRFTGDGEAKLRGISGTKLWRSLVEKKEKKFPTKHLQRWGKLLDVLQ